MKPRTACLEAQYAEIPAAPALSLVTLQAAHVWDNQTQISDESHMRHISYYSSHGFHDVASRATYPHPSSSLRSS